MYYSFLYVYLYDDESISMMYEMRLYRRGIILTDTVIYPVSSAPFCDALPQKRTHQTLIQFVQQFD